MTEHLKDSYEFVSVPEVGDTIHLWFSKIPNNVLEVRPYDGKFTEYYTHIIKVKANTKKGWMETCINVR